MKHQRIVLVAKEIKDEQPGFFSIFFERPAGFDFEAGDWMDITFEGRTLRGGRTYSLSSSPSEGDLRITFRQGVSEFKTALQTIEPGAKLFITKYGNDYDFRLNQDRASTLIAGGIGIAPFRSMIKEMSDMGAGNDVQLIFLNRNDDFLFRSELDGWARDLRGLSITYVPTRSINRKQRERTVKGLIKSVTRRFYISGPEGMVEAHEHLLIDMGVPVKDIRIDSFGGYE